MSSKRILFLIRAVASCLILSACTSKKAAKPSLEAKKSPSSKEDPSATIQDLHSEHPDPSAILQESHSSQAVPSLLEASPSDDLAAVTQHSEWLKKHEGSYTLEDLMTQEDEPWEIPLNSGWFFGGSNSPQLNLRLQRNLDTGQLEIQGGELYLPKKNFGISHEQDDIKDETRTFFNLKRDL
jgi:hypothetical protein